MATEKEKMLAGELYNSLDPQLVNERRQARELTRAFNATTADEGSKRKHLLIELLGSAGSAIGIEPPFFCDYGYNIHLGDYVFFNFNCIILDVMRVDIGSQLYVRSQRSNLHRHPSSGCRRASQRARICQTDQNWLRRVGRRLGGDQPGRHHRRPQRDRRRQRGGQGHTSRCVCRRQPVQGDSLSEDAKGFAGM